MFERAKPIGALTDPERRAREEKVQEVKRIQTELYKLILEFQKRPRPPRNFQVNLEKTQEGHETFVLVAKNGKLKDLSSLMAPGWQMVDVTDTHFGNRFQADDKNRTIEVDASVSEHPMFLALILHEIGHTHQQTFLKKIKFNLQGARDILEEMKKSIKKSDLNTISDTSDEEILRDLPILSESYWKSKVRAHEERNAWEFSLKKMRELKKEGFDPFSEFSSVSELRAYITYFLYTYELGTDIRSIESVGHKKSLIFTKNAEPRIKKAFDSK